MQHKNILTAILTIFALALSSFSSADSISGAHSKELKYKCKDDRPRKTSEYDEVLNQAKVNALRTWAAKQSVATSSLFAKNEEKILASVDEYFLNASVDYRCKNKSFRLKVKGLVDKNKIAMLGKSNQSGMSQKRSRIVAIFMARKASEVKSYQDKVTSVESNSAFSEGAETVSMSGSSASSEGYNSQKNVRQTGGSTVTKSDKVNWTVYRANGVSSAVRETLSSYGFRVTKPAQIIKRNPLFDPDAFREDFTTSNGSSDDTEADATEALEDVGVPLFVIGTLDVGQKGKDPASGLVRVNATVTAEVQYLDDGWWETVASVRPTQYAGLGPNESVAETNALIKAAEAASNEIVQQLNAAGIN